AAAEALDRLIAAAPDDPVLREHRALLDAVAADGIDAVYRRLELKNAIEEWLIVAPNWTRSANHLMCHQHLLLDPWCREHLGADPLDDLAMLHADLLVLAVEGQPYVGYMYLEERDPDRRAELLAKAAATGPEVHRALADLAIRA
ncbi:MAG TPA: hypothetical protein VL738_19805, partial [Dactylosporangium sp.]|nr:hypothetical protein [Dactylosporangium sp.]